MNISKNSILVGLTLCSALIVTGCDKSDTTTEKAVEPIETTETVDVSAAETEKVATEEIATEEVAAVGSADSKGLAHMLATTTVTAFFMPFTMSDDLSDEQVSCLKNRDSNLGVAEAQSFLQQHLTDDEIQTIDEFYETDTGKRVNQYSQEQMLIASGETVENPMGEITSEEMAEMQEYAQQPAFQKLASIDEATSSNQLMEALTPVINSELKRCGIDATL